MDTGDTPTLVESGYLNWWWLVVSPACSFVSQALHVLGSLGIGAQGGGDALGGWVVLSVPLSDTPQPPLSPLRQIFREYQSHAFGLICPSFGA